MFTSGPGLGDEDPSEEPCMCQTAFTCMVDEHEPAPVDWPARFRAAAEVASNAGLSALTWHLTGVAERLKVAPSHVVKAIGRELLGEGS